MGVVPYLHFKEKEKLRDCATSFNCDGGEDRKYANRVIHQVRIKQFYPDMLGSQYKFGSGPIPLRCIALKLS